jgi:phospholipid/cholesterol/gamma-HCH transport system substrate-binding protein
MKSTLETKLGMFFLMAILAAFLIFEVVGGADFFKGTYPLHSLFTNVQELKEGDPVKLGGKQIGRVEVIDFEADKLKVTMKIEKQYRVKTDAKASIRFAGLMGQNFVAIDMGTGAAPFLEAGKYITPEERPDLNALMAKLDGAVSGIENLTKSFSGDQIQNVLGPLTDFMKQNNPRLTAILANLQTISTQIADGKGTVGKLIADDTLYNSALDTVRTLNGTADDIKLALGDAKGMITDAKGAMAEAQGALKDARLVINNINAGEGTMGKLLKDEKLYTETTLAMSNLREIMEKINRGQGFAGKVVNDETLFKNVKMTLQKVDKATEGLEDTGPLSVLGTAVNSLF